MNFNKLKISDELLKAIEEIGFTSLTPIQENAIPHILEGKDIIAKAPTGTGKTCAYGIPSIEKINIENRSTQVLILCPTRELVIQSENELNNLKKYKKGIKITSIYGGTSISEQIKELRKGVHIVIGTPGRIMDHLKRNTLKIKDIQLLVLDEADEMLNMGFREDIDTILKEVKNNKLQTLLFSATMPKDILEISKKYQKDAIKIETIREKEDIPPILQYFVETKENQKEEILCRILDANQYKLTMIFTKTKKRADNLALSMQKKGYLVEALHGDLTQDKREIVMEKFRKGLINILIATDVAARGIDVENVDSVINFDLSDDNEFYIHRIGRTGRAGKKGLAITFINKKQYHMLDVYEKMTKSPILPFHVESLKVAKENRIDSYLNSCKEFINEDLSIYLNRVNNFLNSNQDIPANMLIAMLVRKVITNYEFESSNEKENNKMDKARKEKLDLTKSKDKKYQRFFINLGEKDGLDKKGLLALLLKECDFLKKNNFCDVFTLDSFSFFEVEDKYSKKILKIMNNKKYKKRQISVEVSEKKNKKKAVTC